MLSGLPTGGNRNPVGRLAKHGVRNITFQSLQWITGCTSWKHWTDNRIQIWFLQKCQRKRKFQRMGLWTSARLQSAFLSQTLFGLKWCLNARRNFFVFWSRGWKIMLDLAGGTTVYLACGATDLRKSYHGLAAIIKLKFKLDNCSQSVIAFSQIGSSTGKVNGCATCQIKHDLSAPGSEHEKVPAGIQASLQSE